MLNSILYWVSSQIKTLATWRFIINPAIGLGFLLVLAFYSCKPSLSTVIFHTSLGEMTVAIKPNLSQPLRAVVLSLLDSKQDSLAIEQVALDVFIQLSCQDLVQISEPPETVALSGDFVLRKGKFYLVQGRIHNDASLDRWEQLSGRKLSPELRELYKNMAAALELEGDCYVLGKLISGKPVLDRIAALPTDAAGKPLRIVTVNIKAAN